MKRRIVFGLYKAVQILLLGLPLILYLHIRVYPLLFVIIGVVYVDMVMKLLIMLDMSIMETSKLREYIEEGRVSKYIGTKYKSEVLRGSEKYKEQVSIGSKKTGIEITRVKGFMWRGYTVRVEDPRSVEVVETGGERIERLEGKVKINGGGYRRKTGEARGILRIDGETKVREEGSYSVIGLTKEGYLKLSYEPTDRELEEMEYAVTFGPHLILDGKKQELGEYSGVSPRTAIGQTEEGEIYFLVVEGRTLTSVGQTIRGVQNIMDELGCVNASLLDGGGSSQLARLNKRLSKGGRGRVVNNIFRVR